MDPIDPMHRNLAQLSGREAQLADRVFERFFLGHPEIASLFGRESLSEREEMVRETLVCVLAQIEGEPWLIGNLEAMGASHQEYGVRDEMYIWWVDCMLSGLAEMLGADGDEAMAIAWRSALEALCEPMRSAGRRKAAAGSAKASD